MKQSSLDRLLKRIGPKRYDATARTFRAWHRLRYPVVFREEEGVDSFGFGKIVIYNAPKACPHEVVHAFFHEIGHCQMLYLDIVVLVIVVAAMDSVIAAVGALLVWQFAYRELTAELYALRFLGWRNVVRGYTHLGRGGEAQLG